MNPVALVAVILIGGLWAIVASAFLIWSIVGLVGALRESRFFDQPSTTNRRSAPKENTMKNRIALVLLLACGLAATSLLTTGCQLFDGVGVEVALVTEDGRTFAVHQTEQGIDIVGEFIEPHTGIVFVLGEGVGNITARDPKTGLQVTITPKDRPAEAGTTNQAPGATNQALP